MGPPPSSLQGCVREVPKDTASFHRRGENRKDRKGEERERERVGEEREKAKLFSFAELTALAKYHL